MKWFYPEKLIKLNIYNKAVLEPRVSPAFAITYFCKHCNIRFDPIPVKVICANLWPHFCWGHMCDSTQVSLCPSPMQIHQSMWIQWPKSYNQEVNDPKRPLDDLWPHIRWCHMCDSTQGSLCPTPMEIHPSVWIQWPFKKANFTLKGQWPLDDLWPHFCWGHMCDSTQVSLCPSPMQIHQSTWIQRPKNFNQKVNDS